MPVDTAAIRSRVDVRFLYRTLFPSLCGHNVSQARCFRDEAHAHGDRSPSAQLHADGFHCHGCGTRLDAIGLVMAAHRCDFRQAVVYLGAEVPEVQRQAHNPAPWAWPEYEPEAARFLADVWALVAGLEPTPEARTWLRSRGIDVDVAWALGCRDWSPVLEQVVALVSDCPAEAMRCGLSADGNLWWPLRGRWPGLAVPAFAPTLAVPCQYRWRFYEPVEMHGKRLKCAAQSRAQPIPLGVWVPDATGLVRPALHADVLVIAEGEPDWLSLHDVGAGAFAVLGLCDVSGGWRSAYSALLRSPSAVVVATHDKTGDPIGKAVLAAMLDLHGSEARRRYLRIALDERRDANDLHQDGALLPVIAGALRRLHG